MISGLLPASLLKMLQRVDLVLLAALSLLVFMGLVTLYSAADTTISTVYRQGIHFVIGLVLMLLFSQVEGKTLRQFAIWLYGIGIVLLILVLMVGVVKKGAQRWLYVGIDIQPAEMMKLAVPMMVAYYFSEKPLPPRFLDILVALILVAIPMVLIMKQPDLGTSLLIALSGLFVIYLAGMSWWLIGGSIAVIAVAAPLMFNYGMHEYQRQRILTLLDPESDLLGTGYHIYQSKIAIGSGGIYGKGWLHGDQSHLDFLPERHTDFIFAVYGEEFGLVGNGLLLIAYLIIVGRGLYIASTATTLYTRTLASALTMTIFCYAFVNMGMVSGILPVVGVPLPLVSYGGTATISIMMMLGLLMGISKQKHRH